MKHYSLAIPRNLAYWMARYSGNWTKKNLCCAVKPCDAGLRFLIFDIYFAHKTEAYILICWLLVLILLESVGCLACLLKTDFYLASFLSRRVRVWAALYCLALAIEQRSFFTNLVLSGYDFAEISLWSLVWKKKLNFFGLLPNTRA